MKGKMKVMKLIFSMLLVALCPSKRNQKQPNDKVNESTKILSEIPELDVGFMLKKYVACKIIVLS